ncbi:quinone oxidoreductase PIG3-like isoform X2 [Tachypleus tridentatus]
MASKDMRAVQFEVGGPEKLFIGKVPIPSLREKEILIRVVATAVNRADLLQRMGNYPVPPGASDILGLEAAGVVEKLGPDCTRGWTPGDKVMALLAGGGYAEFVASHEDHIMPVPKGLSFEEAASIPEAWLTSYQLLHKIGQIQREETVLIHAGASGVGLAAVQLARLANATVFVTAGSEEKIKKAIELGAKEGFNYKQEDFSEKILQITEGRGVNVILDCVGASYWEKNVKSIAIDGCWILFGLLGGSKVNGDLLKQLLAKRVRLEGTTLRSRSVQYKAELVKEFSKTCLPHLTKSGALKTVVNKVFSFEKVDDAHHYMTSNQNIGKIVIQVQAREASEREEL